MYKLLYSRAVQKDAAKIKRSHLSQKCEYLLDLIAQDPFTTNPPYEKLDGNLDGFYSRRINMQHRLVYEVDTESKIIKVFRMWSHYE